MTIWSNRIWILRDHLLQSYSPFGSIDENLLERQSIVLVSFTESLNLLCTHLRRSMAFGSNWGSHSEGHAQSGWQFVAHADFPLGWCACQLPCPNRPSPAANQALSLFALFCYTAQVKKHKNRGRLPEMSNFYCLPGKAGGSPSVISATWAW